MARTHTCNKEAEIAVIKTKLENVEEKINDIHKILVGNGRPGLVDQFNMMNGAIKATQILGGVGLAIITLYLTYMGIS